MMYKGKFFIPVERNVGVETPTYGDYRLSSNRKVLKRKFSVLPENYVGVEPPVPTVIFDFCKNERLRLNGTYQVSRLVRVETHVPAMLSGFRRNAKF